MVLYVLCLISSIYGFIWRGWEAQRYSYVYLLVKTRAWLGLRSIIGWFQLITDILANKWHRTVLQKCFLINSIFWNKLCLEENFAIAYIYICHSNINCEKCIECSRSCLYYTLLHIAIIAVPCFKAAFLYILLLIFSSQLHLWHIL